MRARLIPILWGAGGALVAFLLALAVWHLHDDHQRLHAIWDLEISRAQQAAQQQKAAPGGS